MKVKTSELTGAALDWAVAMTEGASNFQYDTVATFWVTLNGKDRALSRGWGSMSFTPSTDASAMWPIIDREKIELRYGDSDALEWIAEPSWHIEAEAVEGRGPDSLTAAARCRVAMYFGDEVDIPDELA